MEAYTGFAAVYDELMDNIPYEEWGKYLIELLNEYEVKDGIVLDLGCGTGNITEILANNGYDMIGVDNSQEMLNIAMEKRGDDTSILYLLQDMREFELYGTVAAVVSICDSLNYLTEYEDVVETFKLVRNYLDPGGIFIFDLNTVGKFEQIGDSVIAEDRDDCSFIWENTFYEEERINEYNLSIFVQGEDGRYDKYEEEHFQRGYTLNEVKKAGDVILFIDEIHTIVGAGAAEGAIDAANILKPLLARGEIQLVGATTLNEYRKFIEKDAALERRFSPVTVNEPSEKETIQILKGIRDKYEAHHNVKITDEAIEAAVKLSIRYVNDRFLPDKAIDLIDEASSKARLRTYTEPDSLKELQEEIEKTKNEKEEAVLNQKFEKAAELRDTEKALRDKFEKEQNKWKNKNTKSIVTITEENIAEVIANWTGIPAKKITEDENEKLKNLEKEQIYNSCNSLHQYSPNQDY